MSAEYAIIDVNAEYALHLAGRIGICLRTQHKTAGIERCWFKTKINMGVDIPGGGLATPFCSYKALKQPPLLPKWVLEVKKDQKSPTKRKHPALLNPLQRDNLILDVYIDV